jgi:hypothetical protein
MLNFFLKTSRGRGSDLGTSIRERNTGTEGTTFIFLWDDEC